MFGPLSGHYNGTRLKKRRPALRIGVTISGGGSATLNRGWFRVHLGALVTSMVQLAVIGEQRTCDGEGSSDANPGTVVTLIRGVLLGYLRVRFL